MTSGLIKKIKTLRERRVFIFGFLFLTVHEVASLDKSARYRERRKDRTYDIQDLRKAEMNVEPALVHDRA